MNKINTYYQMTKPGIIYGNFLTAMAGFFLASQTHVDLVLLVTTMLGISMVIGSACVFNNYIDRDIDKVMTRTKKRALVEGTVAPAHALIFGIVIGLIGLVLLILHTNWLTVVIGLVAFVDYVVLYGYSKRKSVHGTLVGAISGAAPIVAGYTAVTGQLDAAAVILFVMMACWQMPHFYSIAIYRLKDYKAANIPVLPAVRGLKATQNQIIWYVVGFTVASTLLFTWGYVGYTYLIVMSAVNLTWLYRGLKGNKTADITAWARKMFFFSLIVVMVMSLMVAIGGRLP